MVSDTKEDKNYLTRSEFQITLQFLATKNDIADLKNEISDVKVKISELSTKEDLKNYATQIDIANFKNRYCA